MVFFLMSCAAATAQLQKHAWKDRVILLFAESPDQAAYQRQAAMLQKDESGVLDRDLVVYSIFQDSARVSTGHSIAPDFARMLKKAFLTGIPHKPFALFLVGKDTGVKMRSFQPVPLTQLFGLIDRMPMRRSEMHRGEK